MEDEHIGMMGRADPHASERDFLEWVAKCLEPSHRLMWALTKAVQRDRFDPGEVEQLLTVLSNRDGSSPAFDWVVASQCLSVGTTPPKLLPRVNRCVQDCILAIDQPSTVGARLVQRILPSTGCAVMSLAAAIWLGRLILQNGSALAYALVILQLLAVSITLAFLYRHIGAALDLPNAKANFLKLWIEKHLRGMDLPKGLNPVDFLIQAGCFDIFERYRLLTRLLDGPAGMSAVTQRHQPLLLRAITHSVLSEYSPEPLFVAVGKVGDCEAYDALRMYEQQRRRPEYAQWARLTRTNIALRLPQCAQKESGLLIPSVPATPDGLLRPAEPSIRDDLLRPTDGAA